ncbi:hypothetical protein D9757_003428 [Collybiopsis confluens]|uniref:Uncharacterized protein n=1 Tax=Collybiopsis confluens TaxID=2823264 RepID=A0A8H5HU21_9AGAR|nr:hypothetical protein D9757_003428 [Collybiopsis confluens]
MAIHLSLDGISRAYSFLQPYTRPTIHIAGTNGKGSVSAITASILYVAGLSVGRFNSPHLVSVHDSINLDGQPVDHQSYQSARNEIETIVRANDTQISSFETLVLTALSIFERAMVDVVVLEVGMGGRLDATNVIPDHVVLVSALTAVDLDHQAFLGATVAAITREKAAIARPGKPFVLGPQKHPEAEQVTRLISGNAGAVFFSASPAFARKTETLCHATFQPPPPQSIELDMSCFSSRVHALLPLHGEHQLDNVGLAAFIISTAVSHPSCAEQGLRFRITPEVVARGISSVSWPGRLSFHWVKNHKLLVLADGAHNPASSATLGHFLSDYCASSGILRFTLTYILSLSHSPPKTPLQTLSPILPPVFPPNVHADVRVAALEFTPPDGMPWVKSVASSELCSVVRDLCPQAELWNRSKSNLSEALKWAADCSEPHLVVVAGSLYLVADFYRIL